MRCFAAFAVGAVIFLVAFLSCVNAVSMNQKLERQRRAAEYLWIELTEGEGKAENHERWERIVRRSARGWYDPFYLDDTAHITSVQDYYRHVLESGWEEAENDLKFYYQVQTQRIEKAYLTMEISKPIPGRYIVMLQSHSDETILDRTITILQQAHTESEGRIRAEHITPMRSIGPGFTATMNSKAVELMKKHPFLDVLENDIALKRVNVQNNDGEVEEIDTQYSRKIVWNLDRIDQHSPKLDNHFKPEGDGHLASVYIIDTGIHYTHVQFEGRAHYSGFDAIDKLTGSNCNGSDCHGHGTHCAGTAVGKNVGVAKKATVYSMRVLDCSGSGSVSGIIEGINYLVTKKKENVITGPTVLSMSLGLWKSNSLNTAIDQASAKGFVIVGAAGNQGGNACYYSPASAKTEISVGATDVKDNMPTFSNSGRCTDIYAPGVYVLSANHQCNYCYRYYSGTSQATPHVAGYMAVILSLHPNLSLAEAKAKMISDATKDVVNFASRSRSLAASTPNRLLYIPHTEAYDGLSKK